MSESSSFGGWVRRMLGWEVPQEQGEVEELVDDSGNVLKIPNRYKMCLQKAPPQDQVEDLMVISPSIHDSMPVIDEAAISSHPSGHRFKTDRNKTPPHRRVTKKEKIPSVLRASIVSPETRIIPPLPRMSVQEDTAGKLSKVLSKLDEMDDDDDDKKD